MISFPNTEAKDLHDNVYALVGISIFAPLTDPATFSYRILVQDAYRIWTRQIMSRERSLNILNIVKRRPR